MSLLFAGPLKFPFGKPSEDEDVLWRCKSQSYSVVIDSEREIYGSSDPHIELRWYQVLKRTPCGARIKRDEYYGGPTRFVNLKLRKQWACETVEEAVNMFRHRKLRQVEILSARLKSAESELELAEHHFKNLTKETAS